MPLKRKSLPDFSIENNLRDDGSLFVAGVDEVGRGTLAGPVVAAAAILPGPVPDDYKSIIRDSKQLSAITRDRAYNWLTDWCVSYGVGSSSAGEIDTLGIVPATKLAMFRAIAELDPFADHLMIDAVELSTVNIPQTIIIKGDSKSQSIAAASIIAKVTRDKLMAGVFEDQFPGYGFADHKGYGTKFHLSALDSLGATPIHRRTFKPVQSAIGRNPEAGD